MRSLHLILEALRLQATSHSKTLLIQHGNTADVWKFDNQWFYQPLTTPAQRAILMVNSTVQRQTALREHLTW